MRETHFEATVALDGIDELGLGPDEQRYLRFLTTCRSKPTRLHTIEAAIGINRRTISEVIEPYLIVKGLIERQPQGRVITEDGTRHVERSSEASAACEVPA